MTTLKSFPAQCYLNGLHFDKKSHPLINRFSFEFFLLGLLLFEIIFPFKSNAHVQMEYIVHAKEILSSEAPRIDGKFSEAVWFRADPITNFTQRDPSPGSPATERSEVYILFDSHNIFIGCRFYDSNPDNIISELRRREDISSSDNIALYFDTFHNHQTGYYFAINPAGIQKDAQIFNEDTYNFNWDAIWESAAKKDSLGWVAEFKIPFFNLRFPEKAEHIWGFNLQREILYKAEKVNWKPVSIDDAGALRMSKLGHLVGLRDIHRSQNFEIYPYLLSGFSQTIGTPRSRENELGFDFRYGINTDVTLDLTANPDFAQVEADVLEINLTRFPTRFPEKRKFFLEGTGIFTTPLELFYSRRIGAKGDILWGSKLTGRTKKGVLEYGVLASQTGDWNYFGLKNVDVTKEKALFGVARIKKGFSNGSNIGIILTNKHSNQDITSRTLGSDGIFLFNDIYRANFLVASSYNTGLKSQNNYYSIGLFRFANPWTFRITSQRIEPNFEINSTGFMAKERYRGLQNFRTVLIYDPYVEKFGIRQIKIFGSGLIGQDIFTYNYLNDWKLNNPGVIVIPEFENGDLKPTYGLFDQSFGVRTSNEMNISWWYGIGRSNELNYKIKNWHHGFVFSSPRTGKWLKLLVDLNSSWGTFYNYSQKYLGKNWRLGGSGSSWLKQYYGLEFSCDYQKTFDPAGKVDGRHFRVYVRNTLLFTKDIFLRLYTQGRWSTTYYDKKRIVNNYLLSILFGWEFNPGSWFYVAYNEGREDLNDLNDPFFQKRDFLKTSSTLVLKIQYAFLK
jgi:hypothetical protein